jgi:hypothetical protein
MKGLEGFNPISFSFSSSCSLSIDCLQRIKRSATKKWPSLSATTNFNPEFEFEDDYDFGTSPMRGESVPPSVDFLANEQLI